VAVISVPIKKDGKIILGIINSARENMPIKQNGIKKVTKNILGNEIYVKNKKKQKKNIIINCL